MITVVTNSDVNSIAPGFGRTQGNVTTASTALSAFQVVRTLPYTQSEFARINLVWATAAFDGVQIVFGSSDAAITTAAGAPVFIQSHGILRWLLRADDAGFKIQATGTAANTLSWWLG